MKKRISVVGLGYVGLPLALLAAEKGYKVVGIDLNKERVSDINKKIDPIGEDFIEQRIKTTAMKASTNFDSVPKSEIILICVPTPVKNGTEPDLGPVKGAVEAVAKNIKPGALLIVESTINPGVSDEVVIPLVEKVSGLKLNKDFYVSHCPERINPGDDKWSVANIPRVAGSSSEEGLKHTVDFYESIVDARIKPMGSLKEAEACKVIENSFRDINIAFVNELAKSFTRMGINVKNVIDGAATKPFAFMPHYPSIGVGGHCIPVDPYYLIEYARGYGFEHEFLSLARSINKSMPDFTVDQLADLLNELGMTLKDTKVLVLGLSYKANVGDDRESPSYEVISLLKEKGAVVSTFDPYFLGKSTEKNLSTALANCDAVILAANHDEFLAVNYQKYGNIKAFIDGKNAGPPSLVDSKIKVRGIGT